MGQVEVRRAQLRCQLARPFQSRRYYSIDLNVRLRVRNEAGENLGREMESQTVGRGSQNIGRLLIATRRFNQATSLLYI